MTNPPVPGPDDHHSGLKEVYDSKEKPSHFPFNPFRKSHKVDIVAVHGIGAWASATWRSRSGVNWLRDLDMLPAQVPNSRIMLYGYQSNWKGSDTIRTTARPIAERLIASLLQKRESNPNRPIIFIAHCFGGIVVMKAMALARRNRPDLLRSVAGIVFFGTPFHGIEGALGNGRIEEYVRATGDPVQGDILSVLRPTNQDLAETLRDFISIATDALKLPRIVCFYEQKESKVWALAGDPNGQMEIIVPMHSGALASSNEILALERNHFDMNKFTGTDDGEYLLVSDQIKKLAESAPGYVERRHRYRLDQVVPSPSRDSRQTQHTSDNPHQGTARQETSEAVHVDISKDNLQEPMFTNSDWTDTQICPLNVQHVSWSRKLGFKEHILKSSPFASAISADCRHVFLLRNWELLLFTIPVNQQSQLERCHNLSPPEGREFHAAKMGTSIIATICTPKDSVIRNSCFVRKIGEQSADDGSWHRVPHENSNDEENYHYTSIAVFEAADYMLVALGMQTSTRSHSHVRVYRVDITTWAAHEIGTTSALNAVIDEHSEHSSDAAKILNFSPDGRLLICSTAAQNRILVWNIIYRPESRLDNICATIRPFGAEMNAKAITAAKCWLTSNDHPYIFITTAPGSQRAQRGHGGEFSFIAPASTPFPAFENHVFHCLIKVQHRDYYSVIDGAVSDSGNAVALVSSEGKLAVMPLRGNNNGGIVSAGESPTIVKGRLGPLLSVFEAAVRFAPDNKRLVAVDKHGTLLVADFEATHMEPLGGLMPRSGQSSSWRASSTQSRSHDTSREASSSRVSSSQQSSSRQWRNQALGSQKSGIHLPRFEFEPDATGQTGQYSDTNA